MYMSRKLALTAYGSWILCLLISDSLALSISALASVTLRRAVKIAPAAAIQINYSVFGLCCEGERGTHILDKCWKLGVAIVTAIPFGRYLLTTNFIERTASRQKYSGDITPVPGRQRIQYVDENWAALDVVLSGEGKAEIRILWRKITGMPLPLAVMVGLCTQRYKGGV
ncbi:hypothetical protein FVEG_11447 [Fusarium verticillioides 7600]|uniref:Uncharacterized protein n=1 Tax=Gibberella moniliformis (strain M3125 / FGSC 7600) TaxID=334819 RepID=W7N8M3_GIBM7|nr:hypothetical protein FVEG_11447 [Fusarium verticillioides 7600]EWG52837.1 hypothetical protein FVEG_11447 [Fusarium verticillioides 7600]